MNVAIARAGHELASRVREGPIVSSKLKLSVLHPLHPERVCWGCDKYCPAHDLSCGNGTERTQHPIELFGPNWQHWAAEQDESSDEG